MEGELNQQGWSSRRVLLAVAMALILGGLLGFGYRHTLARQQAVELRRVRAQGIVDAIMLRYHWEKWETNPEIRPFVDDLSRDLERQQYRWDFIQPNSTSKGTPQDEFEHAALNSFQRKEAAAATTVMSMERIVTQTDGKQVYEYLQPIYVKNECIPCHNTLHGKSVVAETGGAREGDLMAIVKVILDVADKKH